MACAMPAWAALCQSAWDGDKIMANLAEQPAVGVVPLRDPKGNVTEIGADQLEAFHEAKERIAKLAELKPTFLICNDAAPNAFAAPTPKGDVIGVTAGMLKMVDGDRDMAAAVIGHEVAHHTKHHVEDGQTRQQILGIAATVLGVVLAAKGGRSSFSPPPGATVDLARLGGQLVSRKFDRDQEREADEVGFQYVVDAGFNPAGAVRLAERFNEKGGGSGLFFDSHPGWAERVERFKTLIAASPQAQSLVARGDTPRNSARSEARQALAAVALEPAYATSDAQKSYTDGMAALKEKNLPVAVRELRASAAAGYAPAQLIVGYWHTMGYAGLAKDDKEAARLFQLAADQDEPAAQNQLGVMYVSGRGVAKDETQALKYFRLAAEKNSAAAGNLGLMHERGLGGLEKDDAEALKWFRLAAEQGNANAQFQLGRMLEAGRGGLEANRDEALAQYRRAAQAGYAPAVAAVKRLDR
jgi:TPR repeat protein